MLDWPRRCLLYASIALGPESRRANGEKNQIAVSIVGDALARAGRDDHHIIGLYPARRLVADFRDADAADDQVAFHGAA